MHPKRQRRVRTVSDQGDLSIGRDSRLQAGRLLPDRMLLHIRERAR